ncbi:microtubule-associated protein 70-5-like [Arachis stenosperma]|uniref:microtubule-associated protein 70-5-like n=1 Tax=Arachis stenosperma TaxID=217475 RepID=UPI0025AB860F|nr:microtubule-associated protein 70-5-like [Arachis stenosperma]
MRKCCAIIAVEPIKIKIHLNLRLLCCVLGSPGISISIIIIYINALDTFNTAVVSPIYYVMFTTLTILASVIMFKLRNEVNKLEERLGVTDDHLKQKNLKIKKLTDEKKCALATQYAAEAALRRVHANQKDDDILPNDSIITPFEAEIKIYKNELQIM